MLFFETKEFWAALIGALATLAAVWLAVVLGLKKLKDTELARLRVKCATDIISYRYVIIEGCPFLQEKIIFLTALNAIPGLFGSNHKIMTALTDFRASLVIYKKASKDTNDGLLKLIRLVAQEAGVPLSMVNDTELLTPFTM